MDQGEIKNVLDHLIKAKIPKPKETIQGNLHHHSLIIEHCHYKGCRYCPKLDRVEQITSHTTGKKYTVRQHVDCKSNNLVYIFTCTKCGQQYVGETKRTLGQRVSEHLRDIRYTKHPTLPSPPPLGSIKTPHLWADIGGSHLSHQMT